jgi:hypothetical protein
MALKFADRVAESTVTVGTGDIMLAGAIDTDHDTFGNQFADTDQMPVCVFGGGKWMTFEGRYNSGANSITKMNFRDSSTGSPISLSGTMTVLCGWGAADAFAAANYAVRGDVVQALTTAMQRQARANAGIDVTTLAKSANYTAVAADYGALIKLTGSATLAFTAAATLGDGWKCDVRNTSTGVWTFDPNGSETINGSTTLKIYPGESCTVECDGAGFNAIGLSTGMVFIEEIVANNSFVSMTFTKFDASRFRSYVFKFNQVLAASSGAELLSRVYTDGGTTPITSVSYCYGRTLVVGTGTTAFNASNGGGFLSILANSNNSNPSYGAGGTLNLVVGPDATFYDYSLSYVQVGTTFISVQGSGVALIAAVNAVQFLFGVGNILSGSIEMYGVTK